MTDARDLVHPKTIKQMATLTPRAYRGIVAAAVRSRWYKLTTDLEYLDKAQLPLDVLIEEATVRSGSVGGEQRRDVRDAITQHAPQNNTGFALVAPPAPEARPADDANAPKRKGFW